MYAPLIVNTPAKKRSRVFEVLAGARLKICPEVIVAKERQARLSDEPRHDELRQQDHADDEQRHQHVYAQQNKPEKHPRNPGAATIAIGGASRTIFTSAFVQSTTLHRRR